MSAEANIVPTSPEVAEKLEQARLAATFDALDAAGGASACLRIIAALTERLRDRIRMEIAAQAGAKLGASE